MKSLILALVIALFASPLYSKEEAVKLKLDEVKIYLSGAELVHSANIKLKAGANEILLENIADNIKPNTINVNLGGQATIMDINEKRDYLNAATADNEVKKLNDSLLDIAAKVAELTNEHQALEAQADILAKNKDISGKDKVMAVTDLKQVSEYFYQTMLNIGKAKLRINKEISDLNANAAKIRAQIAEISGKKNQSVHQIVLNLNSKAAQTMDITVKYIISEAGWSPFYDIRVKDINSPVVFQHKANVWQSSGMDFNDVKLTISTRNPSIYGEMPTVATNYLRFIENSYKGVAALSNSIVNQSAEGMSVKYARADKVEITVREEEPDAYKSSKNYAFNSHQSTSDLNPIMTEMTADINYTIPNDGKTHLVELRASEAPADYEYYAAPKYRPESFLVARINNWEDFNLLPGSANVFYENSYIGQTAIKPEITTDTMAVSLGVDKNIIVTREKIKDFTQTKFFSSDIERIFAYKISVKNTKKSRIKITLEDQIPVSTHEDIKVKAEELSSGTYDKESGKIKWIEELEPGKSLEKTVKYTVRHPAGKNISE